MNSAYDWMDAALATVQRAGWQRKLVSLTGRPGSIVWRAGREVVNFASNDYLGLAGDDRLAAAAIAAIQSHGTGATGSRLISGQRDLHAALEAAIADLKQTEAAMVFSSGYLANLGTIASLVGPRDGLWGDQYNHASLRAGAKLSGGTVATYAHGDLEDLRRQLAATRPERRRGLILTDTVFSMDGDVAPLVGLMDLAAEFDCMVLVDEAHATGVLGARGAGAIEQAGLGERELVQVGTLSKALGSLGGYVTGSARLIEFLRQRAASWIYTTGLSPADAAAALAAIAVVHSEPERRDRLRDNTTRLRQGLQTALRPPGEGGLKLLPSESPILCLQVASPDVALAWGQALELAGFWVGVVRPPTVPTSRLRLSVRADHQPAQIDRLLEAIAAL